MGSAIVDKQSTPRVHLDVFKMLYGIGDHRDAFFYREQSSLGIIYKNCDNYFIEESACSFDNVKMSVGDGIKGSGTDCFLHGRTLTRCPDMGTSRFTQPLLMHARRNRWWQHHIFLLSLVLMALAMRADAPLSLVRLQQWTKASQMSERQVH